MLKLLSTIKVPNVIVQLFRLTYRYFFVSIHEAQSVLIAKEARTYVHKRTINMQALKDLGSILATLFIRTYERSERVYLSDESSWIRNRKTTQSYQFHAFRFRDAFFASALIISVCVTCPVIEGKLYGRTNCLCERC